MVIQPQGTIRLLKTPLDETYEHTLNFSSKTAQTNYFNSLPHYEYEDVTYVRADDKMYVNISYDTAIQYDYVMYQNEGYSDKWFYAFITDYTYESNECCGLKIKTDVFQTWMFDYDIYSSFIEREHVSDDTIGKHTFPEQLELGEYISCDLQPGTSGQEIESKLEPCYCVMASKNIFTSYSYSQLKIPTGLYYFGLTYIGDVSRLIAEYDARGYGESIYGVFVATKGFFYGWDDNVTLTETQETLVGSLSASVIGWDSICTLNITRPNYIGKNYIPKNNKLYCYPFNFLQVSNHSGEIVTYLWEYFNKLMNGTTYSFDVLGALCPGMSMIAYPIDYKNILNNTDECIKYGKYPVGSWVSDVYINWLTQQSVNFEMKTQNRILDLTNATIAGATGNIIGGISGYTSIIKDVNNQIGEVYVHSLTPPQAGGNINVGDITFCLTDNYLEFKRISISDEYAAIIDGYFSKYGYKVNEFKVPNLNSRTNWNYIKTIGIVINPKSGTDVLQNDLAELKEIYNKGITIWHNPSTMFDYSQSNNIVS